GRRDRQATLGQFLRAELRIVAFQAYHHRYLDADILDRRDDAVGNQVAAHDAAKDIHEHGFHLVIRQDDLERFGDTLTRGATTDVEEVGRKTAFQLDQVHGRHGQ